MVEPICALPPLSESLRDSQGTSSVQHRTVIDGMRGPHWGMPIDIYVLCNRWVSHRPKKFFIMPF